ncbi:MAG: four helix bundle protein [Candidatus Vogelbacteria bacterium]|nr:four helix bundle protein [Candidatus Vogelbacteria bacterium]
MLLKEKEAYQYWLSLHRDLPKVERLGFGQKIEQAFLDVLELTFTSSYLPPESKIIVLSRAISRLDVLKFFLQRAWESKVGPTAKQAELTQKLLEIGRQLGGWKKGLQEKIAKQKLPSPDSDGRNI